jgi:hypothetical protein
MTRINRALSKHLNAFKRTRLLAVASMDHEYARMENPARVWMLRYSCPEKFFPKS